MGYIDSQYIRMLGSSLDQFKEKGGDLFQFRCPFCLDSKKSKTKARGYIYNKKNKMNYRCHNCGASMSASNFIKLVNPDMHKEYLLEKFKNKYVKKSTIEKLPFILNTNNNEYQDILRGIPSLIELDENHIARLYTTERQIPDEALFDIYYVSDMNILAQKLPKYKNTILDKTPRIILPFRNKHGKLTHIQGRAIDKVSKSNRYITLEIIPDQIKIFGEDRANFDEVLFVVEGPIDSLFLDNAVAMGGADVDYKKFKKDKTIFIYDNETSPEIINRMKNAVAAGFRVCIWGTEVNGYNDINNMMEKFETSEKLREYILYHSKTGLSAELEITKLSKR